jgi:hypothetical protein
LEERRGRAQFIGSLGKGVTYRREQLRKYVTGLKINEKAVISSNIE